MNLVSSPLYTQEDLKAYLSGEVTLEEFKAKHRLSNIESSGLVWLKKKYEKDLEILKDYQDGATIYALTIKHNKPMNTIYATLKSFGAIGEDSHKVEDVKKDEEINQPQPGSAAGLIRAAFDTHPSERLTYKALSDLTKCRFNTVKSTCFRLLRQGYIRKVEDTPAIYIRA